MSGTCPGGAFVFVPMRLFFIILCYITLVHRMHAQKEDYTWMLGGLDSAPGDEFANTKIHCNEDTFNYKKINHYSPLTFTNASICDANGDLVAYTNGTHIYNRNHNIMQNGNALQDPVFFASGYRAVQGALLLPLPESQHTYLLISADIINFVIDAGFKPLHFSTIDLNYNNGLGKVTVKKSPINSVDTLNGGRISAVRHANGRDWWVITSKWESNIFVKYLLGPDGIAPAGEQTVSGEPMHNGIANAVFSPDGQWHAVYALYGDISTGDCGFHLFRFDRCTGEFSQPFFHMVDDMPWPGSAVFSPDSRFLYIIRWDRILQYDLTAPDLLASETLVAEYDGFLDERGLATRFFMAQLAPDNRIYINIPNWNSRYLHVIDQPNAKGDSCNVIQHAIFLPTYNSFSFPNFPNFRLYAEAGSICDSIVVANPPEPPALARQIRVWPVPAAEVLHFSASGEWPGAFRLQLFDALGRPALDRDDLRLAPAASVPLDDLPPGMYFYVLSQQGRRVQAGKVVRAAE